MPKWIPTPLSFWKWWVAEFGSALPWSKECLQQAVPKARYTLWSKSKKNDGRRSPTMDTPLYTSKHGQYLAFIYSYTKIMRQSPAEKDFQRYFKVSPPSVHQMIVTLEEKGFISRTPSKPRSIQLLLSREELPDLE